MAKDNLGWVGNNRGALTTAQELTPETLKRYAPTLLLADPKEDRAAKFGEILRKRFPTLTLSPKPLRIPRQSCHRFQMNPATDSTAKLPSVPHERCH